MAGWRLRAREPEGRRRQDDDRDQPRRLPRRGRRALARRRPRPAGERDLGARRARERDSAPSTCSTARRSRSWRSPPGSPNLDLVPSKPELAGAAVELAAARATASASSPMRSQGGADDVRLRLRRLPALARAADGERARRRRPRDRPRAGRVLRARGARAARALGEPRPAAAQPAPRARRAAADDGGRPHAARRRRRRRGAPPLRQARLRAAVPALRAGRRVAEPRPARDRLRPALGRRRGLLEGGDGACRAFLQPGAPRPRPRPRGPDRRRRRPELREPAGRRDPPESAPAAAPLRLRGDQRARRVDPRAGPRAAGARPPAHRRAATS